jgi:hypothetical protein
MQRAQQGSSRIVQGERKEAKPQASVSFGFCNVEESMSAQKYLNRCSGYRVMVDQIDLKKTGSIISTAKS